MSTGPKRVLARAIPVFVDNRLIELVDPFTFLWTVLLLEGLISISLGRLQVRESLLRLRS